MQRTLRSLSFLLNARPQASGDFLFFLPESHLIYGDKNTPSSKDLKALPVGVNEESSTCVLHGLPREAYR